LAFDSSESPVGAFWASSTNVSSNLVSSIASQTKTAATAAPSGTSTNTQTWLSALGSVSEKIADPIDRAGLMPPPSRSTRRR
jgi:phage major head subunit gpT-like protein